jgi:hypothetical protein
VAACGARAAGACVSHITDEPAVVREPDRDQDPQTAKGQEHERLAAQSSCDGWHWWFSA